MSRIALNKNTNRFSIKRLTLYAAAVSFLLFDNYIAPPGIRPFDFLGWAILLVAMAVGWLDIRLKSTLSDPRFLLCAVIVLPGLVLGIGLQNSWSALLLSLGLMGFLILNGSRLFEANLLGILKFALLILAFGMFFQFLLLILTGEVTPMLFLVTEEATRSNFGGLFYRPTGFYIEPSEHSLAVFTLMCAYATLTKRKDWIVALAAVSIALSLSLAGILAVLAFYAIPVIGRLSVRYFTHLAIAAGVFFIIFIIAQEFDAFQLGVLNRIDTVIAGGDGSARDRLMLLFDAKCHAFLSDKALLFPILGSGASSDAFTDYCGANNIAWMLFSLGYVGTFVFILLVFYNVRSMPLIVFVCVYILFASQLSSFGFFWMYAAILTVLLRKHHNQKKLVQFDKMRDACQ